MEKQDSSSIAAPLSPPSDVAPATPQRSAFRRLGPAGILAIVAIVLPVCLVPLLALYRERLMEWREWLAGHIAGPLLCIPLYIVIVGFALLPTLTLSLFAGWVFGFPLGAVVAILGFGGGAYINYVIALKASGNNVVETIENHPRWAAIYRAILGGTETKTFLIITLLRVPTFPPFGATTIALAAMKVRLRPFLLGTMTGCIPRTALYVWLASQLPKKEFDIRDPTAGTHWLTLVISAIATLIVLSVIAVMARRALKKLTAEHAAAV